MKMKDNDMWIISVYSTIRFAFSFGSVAGDVQNKADHMLFRVSLLKCYEG